MEDHIYELQKNGWWNGGGELYSWHKNEFYIIEPHGVPPLSEIGKQLPELTKSSNLFFLVDTNEGKPWEILAQTESPDVMFTIIKLKGLL